MQNDIVNFVLHVSSYKYGVVRFGIILAICHLSLSMFLLSFFLCLIVLLLFLT